MEKIKSKPGLLNFFDARTDEIRAYFEHLPALIAEFPLDVALAYAFSQVERAHVMALYCGVRKLHRADANVARRAITSFRIKREDFRVKYQTVYGKPIPDAAAKLLNYAEAVRDKVMHGKNASDDDKRNALAHLLAYGTEFNNLTARLGGPRPFGDLRGFIGAGQALDKSTTRWILKGMGFIGKNDADSPDDDSPAA